MKVYKQLAKCVPCELEGCCRLVIAEVIAAVAVAAAADL